jgi:hypothetical protein
MSLCSTSRSTHRFCAARTTKSQGICRETRQKGEHITKQIENGEEQEHGVLIVTHVKQAWLHGLLAHHPHALQGLLQLGS